MKRTYPVKVKLPQEISSSSLYRFPEPICVLLFSQFFLYLSTSLEKPTKPQPTTIPQNINSGKWTINSWKSKKALQLPGYPNQEEPHVVLKTLDDFPPIIFAGEARTLEEHLGDAAMGNAFLLQGGDYAESSKEFNANNIRDAFRIILQMSVIVMFGGQVLVIKVGRMAEQFVKSRYDSFEEKNGVKLTS